jgi:hypothetical protein
MTQRGEQSPRCRYMEDATMRVRVTISGKTSETTLDDFLALNDRLDDDELAHINETLARGETYRGGGGGSPSFTIEPAG